MREKERNRKQKGRATDDDQASCGYGTSKLFIGTSGKSAPACGERTGGPGYVSVVCKSTCFV